MGSMSIWHWILVLGVALLLFGGRGKISELMGDFAKGIKSFKKGLTEEDKAETDPVKTDPKTSITSPPRPRRSRRQRHTRRAERSPRPKPADTSGGRGRVARRPELSLHV